MVSVARKLRREQGQIIGLVPTMGALHDGHLSLVREARRMCDVVVVSVFVNPTQFAPGEDFERYPRDLTQDTALLTDYSVDFIFAPSPEEMYPKGFCTYVTVEGLSDQLEGVARPGHFRGVATVVTVLLNLIHPDFAFFGQKDAQQTLVIKRLIRDLALDSEVVVLPTVREPSGLALASRNAYLDGDERKAAAIIYRALTRAESAYAEGERNSAKLAGIVRSTIESEPRAKLDYVSVTDADSLGKLEKLNDRTVLIAAAARFGQTRLLDNIVLNKKDGAKVNT
jgi:pantoate--beta-alanine ligase